MASATRRPTKSSAGDAIFVLFHVEPLRCLLAEATVGERFVIPPGWHRGSGPMVFADVVARAVVPDYSLLRQRSGAPLYLGPDGVVANPRYPACIPTRVRASELPAPGEHGSLAAAFFVERHRPEAGRVALLEIMGSERRPTAVFVGGDYVALGVLGGLAERSQR